MLYFTDNENLIYWSFGIKWIIKYKQEMFWIKNIYLRKIIYYYFFTNNLIINYLSLMIRGDSEELKYIASSQILVCKSSKEIQDGSNSRRDHLF